MCTECVEEAVRMFNKICCSCICPEDLTKVIHKPTQKPAKIVSQNVMTLKDNYMNLGKNNVRTGWWSDVDIEIKDSIQ